jgi:hypothetical protein
MLFQSVLSPSIKMEHQSSEEQKLKDGPCAKQFEWLEKCAQRKQSVTEKQKMQSCPSETDLLIRCMHRHPLYFQKES